MGMREMAESILGSKKIRNEKELAELPKKTIKDAIWRDTNGKVLAGTIDFCDCGTPFYVNAVNVLRAPLSLIRDLDNIELEECSYDHETEKCMFCPN